MGKVSDWELWACANHFVSKHGADAPLIVAQRADELLAGGEPVGAAVFAKMAKIAQEILNPPPGTRH